MAPPGAEKLWQLVRIRARAVRRTKQVGTQQAVYVKVAMPSNLDGKRAQWPGSRTKTDLDFARREHT